MQADAWRGLPFPFPDRLPCMLAAEERQYLAWLGQSLWSGAGSIVEIGPWLGGSTFCLAWGMRASGRPAARRLHVYDNFIWREFMSPRASEHLKPGDSFEPLFRRNLDPFRDLVVCHRRALPDEPLADDREARAKRYSEHEGVPILDELSPEPVEILFIDGAKSWRGMKHLLRVSRDRLLPGTSYLVCQDFKYWGTYWVPAMMMRLRQYLDPAHNVLTGTTVSFRLRAVFPPEVLEGFEDHVADLDRARTAEDLDRAGDLLLRDGDRLGALNVALARVSFLSHRGLVDEATTVFRQIQRRWPMGLDAEQLERARRYLADEKGTRVPRPLRLAAAGWARPWLRAARRRARRLA